MAAVGRGDSRNEPAHGPPEPAGWRPPADSRGDAAPGHADLSLPGGRQGTSPDLAVKRAHVYVTGQVQGVHFRVSARRKAEELNVRGWVRNLPDGRVEAVFEGTPFAVEQLVAWCHRGPDGARVRHVEVGPADGGPFASFEVLRTPR